MQIKNATYGGERPLFASHGLRMEHVTIQAGESALKECSDIEAVDCRFEAFRPFYFYLHRLWSYLHNLWSYLRSLWS